MTEEARAEPEPPEDEGNRNVENAVMLGFFVVLVAAGIWLLGTMADVRKAQDCAAQGRRNCATIEVPDRRDRRSTERRENRDAKNILSMALVVLIGGPDALAQSGRRRCSNNSGARAGAACRRRSAIASRAPATCPTRRT